ncbi:hypothetical protein HQQ81_00950 [Microbacteriaceae bacterium VKM Ac-2854]|nr:hypothetical protein [Microbacteriaceae bacterium VKM Ac-2854]
MSLFAHRTRATDWTTDERVALSEAVAEDRAEAWRGVGALDRTVVATLRDPAATGGARWPSAHQYFLRIARHSSAVIASDGLSDPFDQEPLPGTGWGCELCLESSALARVPSAELWNHWQFQLLYEAAQSVAQLSIDLPQRLRESGFVSMELLGIAAPPAWLGERGGVGVVLGLERSDLPSEIAIATGTIRLITVTPLWPREHTLLRDGDAEDARALTQRLAALPAEELVHPSRPELV